MTTLTNNYSAVFSNKQRAEAAVKDLRDIGISKDAIAVITKHETGGAAAQGAAEGLAVGAGVGALFGLAATLIPGVGPFITAGWLATTLGATGGAAAAGAIVGGSAGLLAGALSKAGYAAEEAKFISDQLDAGGVLVAVKHGTPISPDAVAAVFASHGGVRYM